MKKKATLFALGVITSFAVFSQPAWNLKQAPVAEDLVSVDFYDELNGWVVSADGTILSTADGGESWSSHAFPQYHFTSIHFASIDQGYIVGWYDEVQDSSLILKTTNGGASWTECDHPKVNRLNAVYFASPSIGWAVGTYDEFNLNCCLYTSDAGEGWTTQMEVLVSGAELFGVHFRDQQTGVACGADGAFLHTNSGGTLGWSFNIAMPLVNLNSVWNLGSQHGCAVGENGTVLYTINDWYQYFEQVSGTTDDLNSVHADPASNNLWAVGNNGTIIHSPGYLVGWTTQSSGTAEDLNDVHMLSPAEGWAVGDNGALLKYSAGTNVSRALNNLNLTIIPNPTDGVIKIYMGRRQHIKRIEVIDILGQVSRTFLPEQTLQSYVADLTDLQEGIYFVKVYKHDGFALSRLILN